MVICNNIITAIIIVIIVMITKEDERSNVKCQCQKPNKIIRQIIGFYALTGGGPERTMKSLCAVGGGLGWRKSFSFLLLLLSSFFLRA